MEKEGKGEEKNFQKLSKASLGKFTIAGAALLREQDMRITNSKACFSYVPKVQSKVCCSFCLIQEEHDPRFAQAGFSHASRPRALL